MRWVLLQVAVALHPSAWWQHAIGAVLSERRDLLQQEARPKLNANQLWHVRQQYIAAYLGMQTGQRFAPHRLGLKAWRGDDALKVWALADIPYLPGDLLIHLLKVAVLTYIQGQRLFRGLMATIVEWCSRHQYRVRHHASYSSCHVALPCPSLGLQRNQTQQTLASVPACLESPRMNGNSQTNNGLCTKHLPNAKQFPDSWWKVRQYTSCAEAGDSDDHC